MNKFNFSKELAKIGYKTVSYYSRAEEKVKDFIKDNTTVIYDTDGKVLKISQNKCEYNILSVRL